MNKPFYEEIRYYYSLSDIYKAENVPSEEYNNPQGQAKINLFRNFLGWSGASASISNILNDAITATLWEEYILPRYWTQATGYLEVAKSVDEMTSNELNIVYGRWYRFFESRLIETFSRYKQLIQLYKENENNLMAKLKSISTTKARENETPQASDIDPYDEQFANRSNVAESINETDAGTVIARLSEIRKSIYSLYGEWADEFASLFMEE